VTRGAAAGLYKGGKGEEAIASQGNGKRKRKRLSVCARHPCARQAKEKKQEHFLNCAPCMCVVCVRV